MFKNINANSSAGLSVEYEIAFLARRSFVHIAFVLYFYFLLNPKNSSFKPYKAFQFHFKQNSKLLNVKLLKVEKKTILLVVV